MRKFLAIAAAVFVFAAAPAWAQPAEEKPAAESAKSEEGVSLPNNARFRVWLEAMGGYIHDPALASGGFESQGRPGYVKVGITGKLNDRLRYVLVINPINEGQPLPACGEKGYFFPNMPQNIGPSVQCDPGGRMRVDEYRFIALDPVIQGGPIREAYLEYTPNGFGVKFGRFILPLGFDPEEAGSFTAKDAPHIQRINSETNFGVELFAKRAGKQNARVGLAAVLGDGNRYRDYDPFYYQDQSLDSNSALTLVASGRIAPVPGLEFRGSVKKGFTGSKVERLPNLFASKRYDDAIVVSAQYRPFKHLRVFGESASYTWGLVETSAELLEMPYMTPIEKKGYYYGVEGSYPITKNLTVGLNATREELSRDDTLVQWLSAQNLYGVSMNKKERSTAVRFYADIAGALRIGFFRNDHSNPFPWVSGIAPVEGERAFQARPGSKWGVVVKYTLK